MTSKEAKEITANALTDIIAEKAQKAVLKDIDHFVNELDNLIRVQPKALRDALSSKDTNLFIKYYDSHKKTSILSAFRGSNSFLTNIESLMLEDYVKNIVEDLIK